MQQKSNKMDIEKMTIGEVLETPEDMRNLVERIKEVEESRVKSANAARKLDRKLKAHPVDRLIERGVFDAEKLLPLLKKVLDKQLQGYSHAEREYILETGLAAFYKTMDDETKKKKNEKK